MLLSFGVTGTYEPNLQDKSVTITQNGTQTISPDEGYDGISQVNLTANIGKTVLPNGIKFGHSKSTNFDWLNEVDMSNITDMSSMFQDCRQITTVPLLDTSNVTTMEGMFFSSYITSSPIFDLSNGPQTYAMYKGCSKLVTAPPLDLSHLIKANSLVEMFYNDTTLQNVPVYNPSSNVTDMSRMFTNCYNLTNESLNNILRTCINAVNVYTKTLKNIGLSSAQATTCTTLSNWTDAQTAGWTTGY